MSELVHFESHASEHLVAIDCGGGGTLVSRVAEGVYRLDDGRLCSIELDKITCADCLRCALRESLRREARRQPRTWLQQLRKTAEGIWIRTRDKDTRDLARCVMGLCDDVDVLRKIIKSPMEPFK